jgi:hypothetical protein
MQPLLTPMASSFFGALFAVMFASRREKSKKIDEKVNAVNRTISVIGIYVNKVASIKRQALDGIEDNPARHFLLRPIHTSNSKIHIEFDSISFLLENECRNIVFRLVGAEENYNTFMSFINKRSDLCFNEYQKRLDAAGLTLDTGWTFEKIESAVGPRICTTLKGMTDNIYTMSQDILCEMRILSKELTRESRKIFPRKVILENIFDDDIVNEQRNEKSY